MPGNPKDAALRIRNRGNWLTLWFVVIVQVPVFVGAVNGVFGDLDPKYVFVGGVAVAAFLAQFIHLWQVRHAHPRCPACGTPLQVVEAGPNANKADFEKGVCPKCHASI